MSSIGVIDSTSLDEKSVLSLPSTDSSTRVEFSRDGDAIFFSPNKRANFAIAFFEILVSFGPVCVILLCSLISSLAHDNIAEAIMQNVIHCLIVFMRR